MARFTDVRGREWTVRITGETICAAAARGIDLEIGAIMAAAESKNGMALASLKFLGQFIELCWLGCRHNSRVMAEKVGEAEFKDALCGKALVPAVLATAEALCECFGLELKLTEAPADPTAAAPAAAKPSASAG